MLDKPIPRRYNMENKEAAHMQCEISKNFFDIRKYLPRLGLPPSLPMEPISWNPTLCT